MNPEEQELMTRAHRLALAQKEVNLLPKLLGLQGDEKQRAEAQLAAIRSERDHLDALLRQDPHAVALEQNRLNEADRANEQVISQTNIDIALGPIHFLKTVH